MLWEFEHLDWTDEQYQRYREIREGIFNRYAEVCSRRLKKLRGNALVTFFTKAIVGIH